MGVEFCAAVEGVLTCYGNGGFEGSAVLICVYETLYAADYEFERGQSCLSTCYFCNWREQIQLVPLDPLGQSSSFGIPFAFFKGLQMSIVKVVFVIVGEGEWSSLVITDIGFPSAKMSKDCLLSRMFEQSRLMA